MAKKYYAKSYRYGVGMLEDGKPICTVFKFSSPVDRDDWVASGNCTYPTQAKFRQACKASECSKWDREIAEWADDDNHDF